MALNVVQYEDVVALLMEVPRLVDRFEIRDSAFAGEVVGWLRRSETALEQNRLPAVSQIATGRATLISAGRGVRSPDILIVGRLTARKLTDATASMVLERASETLQAVIAERHGVFAEAERIAHQAVTVADAKRLLHDRPPEQSNQAFLESVSRAIEVDSDLASAYVHLVSLVGRTDVLVFLDRALTAHTRAQSVVA